MPCVPPAIWATYGSLCELALQSYRHPKLPAWFADLTSLKKPTLASSSLQEFPSSLLKLTQLQQISLCLLVFPKDIVHSASFLHLTRLALRLEYNVNISIADARARLPAFQEIVYALQATLLRRLPHASVGMAAGGRGWSFEQTL